jgi:hypothetical protein
MMSPITEVLPVRKILDEPLRRWFRSADFDLFVWVDESGAPTGFQLCYDKPRAEHALTWTPELGFLHTAVDDGENVGLRYKAIPSLAASGYFDARRLSDSFAAVCTQLPADVAAFVDRKLRQHPNYAHGT